MDTVQNNFDRAKRRKSTLASQSTSAKKKQKTAAHVEDDATVSGESYIAADMSPPAPPLSETIRHVKTEGG